MKNYYKKYDIIVSAIVLVMLSAGCAVLDPEFASDSGKMIVGVGAPVPAAAETEAVATVRADAADDAEIWVDRRDPARGVIIGTDKQAGLYVYDLAGRKIQFLAEGRLNNVDLREGFSTPGGPQVLVAASDRDRMGVALYLLNPSDLKLSPWGVVSLDLTEPYGLCMGRSGEQFQIVVNGTDGQVRQGAVSAGPDGRPVWTELRRFGLASQTEGCVVDDEAGRLFIGEEARGIWDYPLDASKPAVGRLIASAPSAFLKPDVEGLTLLREPGATWLIASSQGDSAFAVWRVDGSDPTYAGRFSVVGAKGVDPVTGTDGVAGLGGQVGPYPSGLLVVQDDSDTDGEAPTPGRNRQNFKMVDWRDVRQVLQLQ